MRFSHSDMRVGHGLPGAGRVRILTAFLFAAWHPPHFHLLGFVIRLALGVATGVLRGADRPLFAAFLAHALVWPIVGLA